MKMNKKGFTLVELMVVLAILGLLAGIGIPQYVRTLENSKEATDKANQGALTRAVQSYVAETGASLPAMNLGVSAKSAITEPATARTSILNGSAITLADFWPNALPTIVSAVGKASGANNWYWNGTKVVIADADGDPVAIP